jgi:mono/diheme cytochrome c family protein
MLAAAGLAVGGLSAAHPQKAGAVVALPAAADEDGRALFMTYCASCHGASARGDGPVALSLRVRPADLTQFAAKNGGVFPAARTQRIIDGRDVGAHGNPDMPVWGRAFRTLPGSDTVEHVKARIAAIVRYLESIQERAG